MPLRRRCNRCFVSRASEANAQRERSEDPGPRGCSLSSLLPWVPALARAHDCALLISPGRSLGRDTRVSLTTMASGWNRMRTHFKILAVTLIIACVLPAAALAQAWPQRPIKMIVPFPAGGGTDFIGRLAAKHLSEKLGQQVYVENRGGANGAIGLQALMQSDPDGYTIAASSDTPLVVNPWLYEKLPYGPLRDFAPVATMVRFPGMLAVHPSVPAHSISELIALAKSKPGALNYASAGIGNFSHLAMELFSLATGV